MVDGIEADDKSTDHLSQPSYSVKHLAPNHRTLTSEDKTEQHLTTEACLSVILKFYRLVDD